MITDSFADLISTQRSRPLSIAVTVLALFVPGSLTLFLSNPDLYTRLGLNGVILFSIAISLPIVMLCFGIWYTPLSAILKAQRLVGGGPAPETDLARILSADDPLEWPCLLAGAWTANLILYLIAALAWSHPLRVGATFLLTAVILLGVWFLLFLASAGFYLWAERRAGKPRAA